MRGREDRLESRLSYVCLEERMPVDHPLPPIGALADVTGAFVEMFCPDVSSLSGGERAAAANMTRELGASTGYFQQPRTR